MFGWNHMKGKYLFHEDCTLLFKVNYQHSSDILLNHIHIYFLLLHSSILYRYLEIDFFNFTILWSFIQSYFKVAAQVHKLFTKFIKVLKMVNNILQGKAKISYFTLFDTRFKSESQKDTSVVCVICFTPLEAHHNCWMLGRSKLW